MSGHPIIAPKKLIEVALPLDAINKACAREKSIRHGHPSTLHLWWARRPLAAARAVLFAQLVNDPSWKYSEDDLKKNQIKGAVTKKRNELFKLITELVQWENTTNEGVLERARKEIRASWKETCDANKEHPLAKTVFDPAKLPAFHDPFAGGGTIPLEAQRLGLESYATDLNPVAVLINKAMIESPPRFAGQVPVGAVPSTQTQSSVASVQDWSGAKGLTEDVRRYGAWVREQAEKRFGHLYPAVQITKSVAGGRADLLPLVGQKFTVIAWLWARTVKSPNPAFADIHVPLASSFVLGSKVGKAAWIEPIVEAKTYRFKVHISPIPKAAIDGTKEGRGANFRCVMSGSPITPEYIKAEAVAGRMGSRMMAVVAAGVRGRIYLSPTTEDEQLARSAAPTWSPNLDYARNSRHLTPWAYGLGNWASLFTSRQLVILTGIADLVNEAFERCAADAAREGLVGEDANAYARCVSLCLSFALSRSVDRGSTICTWDSSPKMEALRNTFARQALPMTWDYAEGNPLSDSSGNWTSNVEWVSKALLALPVRGMGHAAQADAQSQDVSSLKVVSTDPPYYDNVPYADLSDFFYVWLRRAMQRAAPELFQTIAVPKAEELVVDSFRQASREDAEKFFHEGMTQAMHRIAESAHPGFPTSVYYAFKQSDTSADDGTSSSGWETFLQAVLTAGFALTGTWPMRTELGNRMRSSGSNALASSIVLVCRPRRDDAPTIARKEFLRRLERALPAALTEMTADAEAPVAPVDLAQAAIGPGMAIYSQYAAVLEADGTPMSVHNALIHINKAIDTFFAQAEGELDADTRFCIGWFQQRGFEPGPYGEADVLARAKGTGVNALEDAGVLSAPKGKVRLLRVKEYATSWDPKTDHRVPVWQACHQICRALGESEHEAGMLLARMPDKQDSVRQLAYYLYTICERQKWAEEARLYNELITSWPAIVEESHKVGHKGTQLDLL